jgi:CxxC motif-containing protein (DUF1111 family)
VCHKPNLGQVRGIYSDLLLHDMGPRLADPALAAAWSSGPLAAGLWGNGKELYPGQKFYQKFYEDAFRKYMPQAFDAKGRLLGMAGLKNGQFPFVGASDSFPGALPLGKLAANLEREWRTPPLWGVADSAPYLHDGRAATLEQAIDWHGGEATSSLRMYKRLKPEQRKQLIAFLKTLVAPGAAK